MTGAPMPRWSMHTRRRPSTKTSLLSRSREAYAARGLKGTARMAGGYAGALLFDMRMRVDTRGTLYHTQSDDQWAFARAYQPVGRRSFHRPLAALDIDRRKFTFVDLGCGKGKALLLAGRAGFGRVVGVELSEELAEVARRNVGSAGSVAGIEVHTQDATEYAFPRDPLVVFLYHPFDEPVLRPVLANLRESLREHPREAYIVYVAPHLGAVLDETPFLTKTAAGASYAVYACDDQSHAPS